MTLNLKFLVYKNSSEESHPDSLQNISFQECYKLYNLCREKSIDVNHSSYIAEVFKNYSNEIISYKISPYFSLKILCMESLNNTVSEFSHEYNFSVNILAANVLQKENDAPHKTFTLFVRHQLEFVKLFRYILESKKEALNETTDTIFKEIKVMKNITQKYYCEEEDNDNYDKNDANDWNDEEGDDEGGGDIEDGDKVGDVKADEGQGSSMEDKDSCGEHKDSSSKNKDSLSEDKDFLIEVTSSKDTSSKDSSSEDSSSEDSSSEGSSSEDSSNEDSSSEESSSEDSSSEDSSSAGSSSAGSSSAGSSSAGSLSAGSSSAGSSSAGSSSTGSSSEDEDSSSAADGEHTVNKSDKSKENTASDRTLDIKEEQSVIKSTIEKENSTSNKDKYTMQISEFAQININSSDIETFGHFSIIYLNKFNVSETPSTERSEIEEKDKSRMGDVKKTKNYSNSEHLMSSAATGKCQSDIKSSHIEEYKFYSNVDNSESNISEVPSIQRTIMENRPQKPAVPRLHKFIKSPGVEEKKFVDHLQMQTAVDTVMEKFFERPKKSENKADEKEGIGKTGDSQLFTSKRKKEENWERSKNFKTDQENTMKESMELHRIKTDEKVRQKLKNAFPCGTSSHSAIGPETVRQIGFENFSDISKSSSNLPQSVYTQPTVRHGITMQENTMKRPMDLIRNKTDEKLHQELNNVFPCSSSKLSVMNYEDIRKIGCESFPVAAKSSTNSSQSISTQPIVEHEIIMKKDSEFMADMNLVDRKESKKEELKVPPPETSQEASNQEVDAKEKSLAEGESI